MPKQVSSSDDTSLIGTRGLVIFRNANEFAYVTEDTWRNLDSYAVEAQTGNLEQLSSLNVSLALLQSQSVFVNLDQLQQLEATDASNAAKNSPAKKNVPVKVPKGASVILQESGKLYVVPDDVWTDANAAISGDAAVLVNRDAVLAPIPQSSVPHGTFCILINFAGIQGAIPAATQAAAARTAQGVAG